MKRIAMASLALAVLLPGVALARPATKQEMSRYQLAYAAAKETFGVRTVGCRLGKTCHVPATSKRVRESTAVLHRMFAPPPAPVSYTSHPAATAFQTHMAQSVSSGATSSGGSGGYSIPSSIVQCESGGSYSAVNPSSGAGGAYQILPSTWAAYGGTGLPQNASPAEQDRIAGEIYARQGASAWSC